jgi:hypothetical protein
MAKHEHRVSGLETPPYRGEDGTVFLSMRAGAEPVLLMLSLDDAAHLRDALTGLLDEAGKISRDA